MIAAKNPSMEWKWINRAAFAGDIMGKAPGSENDKKGTKMTKSWPMVFPYFISGEESRLGRKDYWNHVFLAGIVPSNRKLLELLKILLVIVFSVFIAAAMAGL
jgi:hypothetical protein